MKTLIVPTVSLLLVVGCKDKTPTDTEATVASDAQKTDNQTNEFQWKTETVGDSSILRYQVPGFEKLSKKQKKLAFYLCEAGLAGRDILFDQKNKNNLTIRRVLESIYRKYQNAKTPPEGFAELVLYTKQVWFASGIHHDYSSAKHVPAFNERQLQGMLNEIRPEELPLRAGESKAQLLQRIAPVMFNPKVDAKRVNKDANSDPIADSANNFYEGLTQKEVEKFYKPILAKKGNEPPSYGLNSKLVKRNGKVIERVWKVGGMYSPAIEKIIYWLEKAKTVADSEKQAAAIGKLIEYYQTGDLEKFDEYNILWVQDTDTQIDFVNGFIEVYGDAIGMRATYESVVQLRDEEASKRIGTIGKTAQWFEDNSPLLPEHKKEKVVGIAAKAVTAICEAGDTAPTTPIGINLPNSAWIREKHGSKSVAITNIMYAYEKASESGGVLEEFAFSPEEIQRAKKYGALASALHVDMHEVIGHASGKLNKGIGTPKETLKSYASALEEGRADLVALYYAIDPKLVELGLMPSVDVGHAEYEKYIRSGLMVQLSRLEEGAELEESHMRNRQMVAKWAYEKGKADNVIERVSREGKTYFVVRDYEKLRGLFGQLLREVQRIKSEGDYAAGRALIENYGVKVDKALHKEVLDRYAKLKVPPYSGFIQPELTAVRKGGEIDDITIRYPDDFATQMMSYSENYSFLPADN